MASFALQQAMVIEDAVKRAAADRYNDGARAENGNQYFQHTGAIMDPHDYFIVEMVAFSQAWPSTALGFGGIGGQMISSAMTTIVTFQDQMDPGFFSKAYVYIGGRFAYSAHPTNGDFIRDKLNQNMPAVNDQDYNMEPA